ncbi:VOC family protein [Breznakiella homolactica]|uniref:VOC family protein n=1 Tax=Breznakiella homolactica TaxID=2798577 RepID=A0A7T7XJU5_9SPIR|nr:VOC family protein [Breznakiella homolactica]QQO07568.1 VOC family protein [Breznakiella homolactica]
MKPIIDHIHITVKNLDEAEKFYDVLLPLLGFDINLKGIDNVPENDYKIIEYHTKELTIGIVSPRKEFTDIKINRRRPGSLHHLAFMVETKNEVDELYKSIKELNVTIVNKPKYYKEYSEDYYAVFFKDNQNIEYEIVHYNRGKLFGEINEKRGNKAGQNVT